MHKPTWQLDGSRATLACEALAAQIDLASPAQGLAAIRLRGDGWVEAGLLGIRWQPHLPIGRDLLVERTARGAELLAAYQETPDHPVRVDALWRVRPPAPGDRFLAAVDLIVSVRTSLLDARPELSVRSRIPACELLYLADAEAGRFQPVSLETASTAPLSSPQGASCRVLRVSGKAPSYVEMVHPLDCPHDELRCPAENESGDKPLELAHRLFARPLEKGVILRSRVRGLWAAREEDTRVAAESYRGFAASEPPLGS